MLERSLIFPVDRDAVLFASFMGLYSTEGAASTFDIWLAAADGDLSGMALVTAAWGFMLPTDFAWGDSASKACNADSDKRLKWRSLRLSVLCADDRYREAPIRV